MLRDVRGKPVERGLDQTIISDGCRAGVEAHKPRGALGVVSKQTVNIGTEHAPVR